MLDPAKVAFYFPPEINHGEKLKLFDRMARHIRLSGGMIVKGDHTPLATLPADVIPVVGCSPQLTPMITEWRRTGRDFLYWDRGYFRRVYATWLPKGDNGGYYRWVRNAFQMQKIEPKPSDRWKSLKTEVQPWRKSGRHIVIAAPTRTYSRFHKTESWIADTIDALARVTTRQLVIRDKESKRSLQSDLADAHCLVTHGSIAAVESVVLGVPVVVHVDSAAALVGKTDLTKIDEQVTPDREPWLHALAYSQFSETEMIDGSIWKML